MTQVRPVHKVHPVHPVHSTPRDIVFMTDFGLSDWYVGVMKGVARAIAPRAALLDLTHDVEPGDVRQGDFILSQAAPHFAPGTVFCVVVDPAVGTPRRPLACSDGERFYVAPDNGVLSGVARLAGDAWRCHEATNPDWRRRDLSSTFHGRDVFAPVAAWLTREPDLDRAGPPADDVIVFPEPRPEPTGAKSWRATVLHVDRFGNAITSFHRDHDPFALLSDDEAERVAIEMLDGRLVGVHHTYADVSAGEALVYWGSGGYLEIGVNLGDAADRFRICVGDPVLAIFP